MSTFGLELRDSGPVYLSNPSYLFSANGAAHPQPADKFEATDDAGHHVTTRKEDGVDHVVQAHLALLLVLQDLSILQHSPCSNPVLESIPHICHFFYTSKIFGE